jgi:hypothetical protein
VGGWVWATLATWRPVFQGLAGTAFQGGVGGLWARLFLVEKNTP